MLFFLHLCIYNTEVGRVSSTKKCFAPVRNRPHVHATLTFPVYRLLCMYRGRACVFISQSQVTQVSSSVYFISNKPNENDDDDDDNDNDNDGFHSCDRLSWLRACAFTYYIYTYVCVLMYTIYGIHSHPPTYLAIYTRHAKISLRISLAHCASNSKGDRR